MKKQKSVWLNHLNLSLLGLCFGIMINSYYPELLLAERIIGFTASNFFELTEKIQGSIAFTSRATPDELLVMTLLGIFVLNTLLNKTIQVATRTFGYEAQEEKRKRILKEKESERLESLRRQEEAKVFGLRNLQNNWGESRSNKDITPFIDRLDEALLSLEDLDESLKPQFSSPSRFLPSCALFGAKVIKEIESLTNSLREELAEVQEVYGDSQKVTNARIPRLIAMRKFLLTGNYPSPAK